MLRNKRGVAIETAVFMMVVIFAMCTLILTVTLFSRHHTLESNDAFTEQVSLDDLGEDFIKGIPEGLTDPRFNENNVRINGNEYTLTVRDPDGKVLLNVVAEWDGAHVEIKRWSRFEIHQAGENG